MKQTGCIQTGSCKSNIPIGSFPGGTGNSFVNAVDGTGRYAVGRSRSAAGVERPFLYDSNNPGSGLMEISTLVGSAAPSGWIFLDVSGIDFSGKIIVGNGVNAAGVREGWWVKLP